jgi:flagellar protein FliL
MSKKDKAEVEAVEGAEAAKPKVTKKKIMLLGIAAVALTVAGVAGKMMLTGPTEKAPEPGGVITMDSVTVNLAGGHYLKMKLALQATADAASGEGGGPDGSKAMDIAISHYSNKPMAELSSVPGREKAKADLLTDVKEAYENKIMDIYFTEFVMQ